MTQAKSFLLFAEYNPSASAVGSLFRVSYVSNCLATLQLRLSPGCSAITWSLLQLLPSRLVLSGLSDPASDCLQIFLHRADATIFKNEYNVCFFPS